MTRWFRFYDDAMHDPKLLRLSDSTYRAWTILLCIASKNEGVLPQSADIALTLRIKPSIVAAWIAELSSCGLLDSVEGSFVPHNWDGRQFKSDTSSERVKRYRERKRNVTETVTPSVSVTPCSVSVSDTVSISLSKKEETDAKFGFDEFWSIWPNKVGKPAALKGYQAAIKRGVSHSDIVSGVSAYINAKPPDRPWLNPATFLNQNRWEDRPAPVSPIAKPLTEFQIKQQETNDVLSQLRNSRNGNRGGGALDRLLPDYHSERSEGLCGGVGQAVLALPRASSRGGH